MLLFTSNYKAKSFNRENSCNILDAFYVEVSNEHRAIRCTSNRGTRPISKLNVTADASATQNRTVPEHVGDLALRQEFALAVPHLALSDDARDPGDEGSDVGEVRVGCFEGTAQRHHATQEPRAPCVGKSKATTAVPWRYRRVCKNKIVL